MGTEFARNVERLRQFRQSRTRTRSEPDVKAALRDGAQSGAIVAGARVFDTISGEEGEVVHGARENVVVSTAK